MSGIDLERYPFDYDLTFCALLMRADGHLYHTFGGRTWRDAQSHLSIPAFLRVLQITDEEHRAEPPAPKRKPRPSRTVEQLPPLARRIAAGNRPDCVHCHNVHDWQMQTEVEAKTWERKKAWRFPDPIQWGLELDAIEQNRVSAVHRAGAKARIARGDDGEPLGAPLEVGDRIVRIVETPIATFGDIVRTMDRLGDARSVTIEVSRKKAWEAWHRARTESERKEPNKHSSATAHPPTETIVLALDENWRVPDPLVYSWRSLKWNLEPAPGFGGPQLTPKELAKLALPTGTFAYRVQYLVTWGPRKHTGQNAARAGIRKGDVILALAEKRDFETIEHVHSWFRLTRKIGDVVPIEILRGGEKRVVKLEVVGHADR